MQNQWMTSPLQDIYKVHGIYGYEPRKCIYRHSYQSKYWKDVNAKLFLYCKIISVLQIAKNFFKKMLHNALELRVKFY